MNYGKIQRLTTVNHIDLNILKISTFLSISWLTVVNSPNSQIVAITAV